jgi:hypothetical protein
MGISPVAVLRWMGFRGLDRVIAISPQKIYGMVFKYPRLRDTLIMSGITLMPSR